VVVARERGKGRLLGFEGERAMNLREKAKELSFKDELERKSNRVCHFSFIFILIKVLFKSGYPI